ncbi:B12-binding domain-containing protein [Methanolobus sp. ZRKC2]|uniref:cobalamin B12-binding domain-containing protein n=1 Tax=Methanolobus sp. ZRKC2 TaxID=3125783 RepID=UPI003251B044
MDTQSSINKHVFDKARCAVIDINDTEAIEAAQEALDMGIDPVDVIEQGFVEGMRTMGDRFEEGKLSLVQILAASKTMNVGIEILKTKVIATNENTGFFGNLVVNY